ncbi:hypothetical protein BV210_08560 [Halorientalis sp. IM1011]|uniref:cupin domain-containing protein n=1 Tax=Halorientalis sp. IM1011 TaxID=1932360 RepID=UPI00097CCF3B|nr:cupin domain-containing protein [Halorientalis sp. IM1011]AQL42758.1 hypothetical protein BV210_08560 [Halorientalis sp. IM1011]
MDHVSLEDMENHPRVAAVQKHATDPLNLADMALNYYELEPGDSFSGGLHTHMNQEEVFLVMEGTATFQTKEDEVEVGENEIVRFAPGEYQEGRNDGEERVRAVAMGAPQDDGETRSALPCQECGAEYHVVEVTADSVELTCPECGNEVEM